MDENKKENKEEVEKEASKNETKEEKKVEANEDTNKNKPKKEKKDFINKLQEEVKEWQNKYYRLYADMDNLRKQYQKDYANVVKYQSQAIVEKLLPSLDVFSMVIGSVDNLPAEVKNYVMGFDAVYRQMLQALESEGVSEIVCKIGDEFNHDIHYAMDTVEVEDKEKENKIVKIYLKGYKLHDRLLRAVTVSVGVLKKENKEPEA